MIAGAITAFKIALFISLSATFMVAINAFISTLIQLVFHSVVGEFIALVSMCLPFDALAVFSSLGTAIAAIGAFYVANKLYRLLSNLASSV